MLLPATICLAQAGIAISTDGPNMTHCKPGDTVFDGTGPSSVPDRFGNINTAPPGGGAVIDGRHKRRQ
jgi:hypothetical protein